AAGIEGRGLLMREPVEVRKELLDLPLDGDQQPDIPRQKVRRSATFVHPTLVGIHAQVLDQRPTRHFTGGGRNVALTADGETEFPVVPADGVEVATLVKVIDRVARTGGCLAPQKGDEVVAVAIDP